MSLIKQLADLYNGYMNNVQSEAVTLMMKLIPKIKKAVSKGATQYYVSAGTWGPSDAVIKDLSLLLQAEGFTVDYHKEHGHTRAYVVVSGWVVGGQNENTK